ncbi:MAG: putative pyridoxine 5'-phosphate oxidase superfamily flavin-nucleotide-binding protein [Chlamydiales bacterium]|jgi:predicted pyridoxine 5'-phosphate oxidase superfamily flavin-nucleotide-binding protein
MPRKYTELTFTDAVRETQTHYGARASAAQVEAWDIDDEHMSAEDADFISRRDGFYMATVNEEGWPYVQFRGGPTGFLKVLDEQTLAYADFRGNRQYISTGNLRSNGRVALFFMDYAGRKRLKVMATSEVIDADTDPELLTQVADADYRAKIERIVKFHVAAFDWNCPQHITQRYTAAEWASAGVESSEGDIS